MKDGRTHLAHKAEHAVDMDTGAIVAVTRQGADVGDTTTIIETAIAATEQVEDAQANVDDRQSLEEIVGEKGYHSNQTLIDLDAVGIRSYVSEPDRGRRDWSKDPEARAPVYGNRRRMRGRRGRRLMRQRGERIERSFAHLYDTGGMRRTHLRGHTNILKRLLIHAGGFNLGLVMRHLIGIGTPRGLQGRVAAVLATLGVLMGVVRRRLTTISSSHRLIPAVRGRLASLATFAVNSSAAITCTTGCYAINVPFYRWLDLQRYIRDSPTWVPVAPGVTGFAVPGAETPWHIPVTVTIYRKKVHHRATKNYQLDLFDPNDGHYEYSAVTSNLALTVRNVWYFACGRGNHEKTIAQLKTGLAFHSVPTQTYAANSAWQQLVVLAHNLLTNFQLETGAPPRRRTRKHTVVPLLQSVQTLRFELFHRAALLVRPGGKTRLRMTDNLPTRQTFTRIANALASG